MNQNELNAVRDSLLADIKQMMLSTGQVTQYIGARYVPLFATPIEWDEEREYEPLTIVTYQGDSYTSRQFVPKGIRIADAHYWALTGNYNAQIEQYRNEVQTFDERITNAQNSADYKAPINHATEETIYGIGNNTNYGHVRLTDKIVDGADSNYGYAVTPELASNLSKTNIALYGAKEDDTDSIINAISEISKAGYNSIFIPAGKWNLTKGLDLTQFNIYYVSGIPNQTMLIGDNTIDYAIKISRDGNDNETHGVNGITFTSSEHGDETKYLKLAISCDAQCEIDNCKFLSVKEGIKQYKNAYGIQVRNCTFKNITPIAYDTTVAIYAGNDSIITNCKIWGFTYGIKSNTQSLANSVVSNVNFWNYKRVQDTYGIYSSAAEVGNVMITGCYFDGMQTSLYNIGGMFVNCIFYWGDIDQKSPSDYVAILGGDGTCEYRRSRFTSCLIGINPPMSKKVILSTKTHRAFPSKLDIKDMTPFNSVSLNNFTVPVNNRVIIPNKHDGTNTLYKLFDLYANEGGVELNCKLYNNTRSGEYTISLNIIGKKVYGFFKVTDELNYSGDIYYQYDEATNHVTAYSTSAFGLMFDELMNVTISQKPETAINLEMDYNDTFITTENYAGYTKLEKYTVQIAKS